MKPKAPTRFRSSYRFEVVEQARTQITFTESPNYIDGIVFGVLGVLVVGIAVHELVATEAQLLGTAVMLAGAVFLWVGAACGFVRSKVILNGETQRLHVQRQLAGMKFENDYAFPEIKRVYETTN